MSISVMNTGGKISKLPEARSIAYHIVDRLSDAELEGFIMMFADRYPLTSEIHAPSESREERDKAWDKFKSLCISRPDFDEERAKDEYFREKYGL